jgi:hypothetical protein
MMRDGFKNAAVYALIYSGCSYSYYKLVEGRNSRIKINERVAAGVERRQDRGMKRPRHGSSSSPRSTTRA